MHPLHSELLEPRLPPALTLHFADSFFSLPAARSTSSALVSLLDSRLSGPDLTLTLASRPLNGPLATGQLGGAITFDSGVNWYFGLETGARATEYDFYSVLLHEFAHTLGFGTSALWYSLSSGGFFHGPNAQAVYGGPVPLSPDGQHWREDTVGDLDPTTTVGTRQTLSPLDRAALRDLGWVLKPLEPLPRPADPFPGYLGPMQWALSDFTGDGIEDWITVPVTGSSHVKVYDGDSGLLTYSAVSLPNYSGPTSLSASPTHFTLTAVGSHFKLYTQGREVLSKIAYPDYLGPLTLSVDSTGISTSALGHNKRFDLLGNLISST